MFSKKILFAGIAAAALCAGQASALTLIDATLPSKVGGVSITSSTTYKVASNLISSTALTAAASNVVLNTVLTAGTLAAGQYYVQYDITGATFDTQANLSDALLAARLTGKDAATPVGSITGLSPNVQARSTTSVKFLVTVGTALGSSFAFDAPIVLAAPGTVSVTATVTSAAGVVQDLGPTTATIITAGAPYKLTNTACDQVARLAQASPATYPVFGSFALAAASTGCDAINAGDVLAKLGQFVFGTNSGTYKDLAGTSVALTDIASFTATPASTVAVNSTAQVRITDGTTTKTSTAGSATLAAFSPFAAGSPTISLTVGQDLSAALTSPSAYTAMVASPFVYTIQPSMSSSSTFSAPAALTATLGSISLEGTTFKASWVGDGSSGYNYVIRLGNSGTSAVGPVTVNALNATGTTTTTTCPFGNIPAKGELVISSASLKSCLGAFGRSDLTIVVNASTSNLFAKMRIISPNNTAIDSQLGGGVTDAKTN